MAAVKINFDKKAKPGWMVHGLQLEHLECLVHLISPLFLSGNNCWRSKGRGVSELGFICSAYDKQSHLGKPPDKKSAVFLTLFKKPLPPPPPFRLNIYVVNFSEGILTKVRKRLSQ